MLSYVPPMSQRGVFYGWVVVAAAATVVGTGLGGLFSLGVFLKPIEESTGWSRTSISLVALVNWLAMGVGEGTRQWYEEADFDRPLREDWRYRREQADEAKG